MMLVIGEQEASAKAVDVRPYHHLEGVIKGSMSLEAFELALKEKILTEWYAKS